MTTWDDYRKTLADAAERFTVDTKDHALTVLHDDGLYRHLRFQQPAPHSWHYRFDLITWPGHLTVAGDFGDSFTFARVEDMFTFFRAGSGWNDGSINPGYWAEKITDGRGRAKAHSAEKFRRAVDDYVKGAVEADPALATVNAESQGLAAAVEEALTDEYDPHYAETARQFLDQFEYRYGPHGANKTFRFEDTWELDFTDWHWSFLWACNAIQWGIGQYDAAKAAEPVPAGAVA